MDTQKNTQTPTRFINQKCGLCSGFGTLKYGAIPCPACRTKGIVVVDQLTGVLVDQEETRE